MRTKGRSSGQGVGNVRSPKPQPINGSTLATPALRLAEPKAAIQPFLMKTDLAQILAVSARSIDRLWESGQLPPPSFMLGRSPRWAPAVIERWLASNPQLSGRKGPKPEGAGR